MQAADPRGRRRRRVLLPSYPFQRKRCWVEPTARAASERALTLRDRVAGAPVDERADLMIRFIQNELGRVLGLQPELVDATTNVFALGLDSLIIVELAATLTVELGHEVEAAALVEYPNIRGFVAHVLAAGGLGGAARPAATEAGRTSRRAAQRSGVSN